MCVAVDHTICWFWAWVVECGKGGFNIFFFDMKHVAVFPTWSNLHPSSLVPTLAGIQSTIFFQLCRSWTRLLCSDKTQNAFVSHWKTRNQKEPHYEFRIRFLRHSLDMRQEVEHEIDCQMNWKNEDRRRRRLPLVGFMTWRKHVWVERATQVFCT